MCPKKVRHKRVGITSWVRTSLAGICARQWWVFFLKRQWGSLQCLARRESALRGFAGPSSGLWRALRCLGLGRRARLGGAGVRQGDDGALSLLRAASDVAVLWMKPMDEGDLRPAALNFA